MVELHQTPKSLNNKLELSIMIIQVYVTKRIPVLRLIMMTIKMSRNLNHMIDLVSSSDEAEVKREMTPNNPTITREVRHPHGKKKGNSRKRVRGSARYNH